MGFLKYCYRRHRELGEFNLSLLLATEILTVLVVGPLVSTGLIRPWVFDLFLFAMALLSINGIAQGWVSRFLIFVGMISLLLVTTNLAGQENKQQMISRMLAFSLFIVTITVVVARSVYNEGPVTWHRIRGAMLIYLNVALIFAIAANTMETFLPGAYTGIPVDGKGHFGDMIYFSLTTLTTTGFGDIVPVYPLARSLANAEEIIGQLYPATLLATLIGRHVSLKNGES